MTEEVKKTVSHSEVEAYLRCPRNHYYGYGLEITSTTEGDALTRGTAGHAMLEATHKAFMAGATPEEAWEVAKVAYAGEVLRDSRVAYLLSAEVMNVIKYYVLEYFPAQQWEVLATEGEFLLEVDDDTHFFYVIDLIVRDRWGQIHVYDAKFPADFYTEKETRMMSQIPKYVGAQMASGFPIAAAGYLIFRTRGKKDDTPGDRFGKLMLEMSTHRVQESFREHIGVAKRLQKFKQLPLVEWRDTEAFRTSNVKTCTSCSFFNLCAAELDGSSHAQLILDTQYKKRERRNYGEQVTG